MNEREFYPKRKPKRLTKRGRPKSGPSRKPKVDIAGLATERAYWQLKQIVLGRPPGGRCERCGLHPATAAHHRKLTAQGGPDVASNLAAICEICHLAVHRNPREARGGGWIVMAGDDFRSKALLLWDGSIVLLGDDGTYAYQGFP